MTNTARLGYGVIIKRYGQGNDPNSEFTARIRRIWEDNKIPWQTYTYKVEAGGGGTIGGFLARENMEVLDCGVPVLSMHSTFDLSSKIDLWWLYRAFEAFYRQ
jgi:aspartyl aminopeptidase